MVERRDIYRLSKDIIDEVFMICIENVSLFTFICNCYRPFQSVSWQKTPQRWISSYHSVTERKCQLKESRIISCKQFIARRSEENEEKINYPSSHLLKITIFTIPSILFSENCCIYRVKRGSSAAVRAIEMRKKRNVMNNMELTTPNFSFYKWF